MLLAVDVGNTNIVLGVFDKENLVFVARIATDKNLTPDQYAVTLSEIFKLHNQNITEIDGAIISSVVPDITSSIKSSVKKLTGVDTLVVGPGLKTGINILIDNPAQVGSDLISGTVAAAKLYKLPALVVDLGTATKISVVSKSGAFCGCIIAPGVSISLNALSKTASLLPSISLENAGAVIGKNSVDSMKSGIVYGTAAMIDGLCNKIEKELNEKVETIVATGGLARDIIKHCDRDIVMNENLVVLGLKCLYDKNTY